MAVARDDPYRCFNFRVGIGGKSRAADGFAEVRFPTMVVSREVPVVDASPYLVLRRGFTGRLDLYEWWLQQRQPKRTAGRIVTVELLDEAHREVGVTWRFTGCRPVALDYSPLDALASGLLIETATLAFDEVSMT
jgi:phage tail-like protein